MDIEMNHELTLTDLIDIDVLQKLQDDYSNLTGMAANTTDADGVRVTEPSNFSDFCMNYTRASEAGRSRCERCDRWGAKNALKKGKSDPYVCHAGLVNFAAPVMAGDKVVGSLVGGQAVTEAPDPEKIRKIAEEIGVDPDEYVEAAGRVRIVEQNVIDHAAKFLYTWANVLSDMAYNRYLVLQANNKMQRDLNLAAQAYENLEKSENMKSDFLANMSHEIRTPMNSVVGMAEMALRENLPMAARNYIFQIKEAGKSLLTIINDILDFSKIESGKMDITEVDYEPMSMLYDVSNIVMTRLKNKDVELIIEVSPNIPNKLWGDDIRIKQVLLNLANNAVKFTSKGKVIIRMECDRTKPDEITLQISVEDTGIGIREEDMDKLFKSFQQVDSKRNRNIEGTGLGLAISKNLVKLMNGSTWVESEYGKGSKFSCIIPQRVIDDTPSIGVKDPSSIILAGLIFNPYVRNSLCDDADKLGVKDVRLLSAKELGTLPDEKNVFLFIEQPMFSDGVEKFVKSHSNITAVLLIDFDGNAEYDIPNLRILRKPLFALNVAMILNGEEMRRDDRDVDQEFDFIAPDAKVLIVDDNEMNLTVAEGLLEPLKMQVDTADGGREAIEKISKEHYDIIFMDHMMPEMDGVEVTHIIRDEFPRYDDVPIIALTANAVAGTKEFFCREGMNDFIAKPIEIRMLIAKVRQWLPVEKLQKGYETMGANKGVSETETLDIEIGDLNVKFAIDLLASEDLFWKVLKIFYNSIDKKSKLIKSLEEKEDWVNYTVEVHALKNSAKQIGAMPLSDKAAALEKAGNARDTWFIHTNTDEMLEEYVGYKPVLSPFCEEDEENAKKEAASADVLRECFSEMKEAVDNLDMDQMEEVIEEMSRYHYDETQYKLFTQLKEASEEMDVDRCEAILRSWEKKLS